MRIPDWVSAFDASRTAAIAKAVEQHQSITQAVMRHRFATFEPRVARPAAKMRGRYGAELSADEQSILLRLLDTRRPNLVMSFERGYRRSKLMSETPKSWGARP